MTGNKCGLFTHKSVPVIFESPCISNRMYDDKNNLSTWNLGNAYTYIENVCHRCRFVSVALLLYRGHVIPYSRSHRSPRRHNMADTQDLNCQFIIYWPQMSVLCWILCHMSCRMLCVFDLDPATEDKGKWKTSLFLNSFRLLVKW
jgi:hypothetical protein